MSGTANLETRAAAIEIRTRGRRLEGHAALFNSATRIGSFAESIRAGAFARSLTTRTDILALVDHNPAQLLARTRSGTLRLSEDTRGLAFELDVPDTTAGRDVLALAERGDLGGMSFGFTVPAGGEEWRGETRQLVNVDLHEISVVSAWPAYAGTDVQARSRARPEPPPLAMARFRIASLGARR